MSGHVRTRSNDAGPRCMDVSDAARLGRGSKADATLRDATPVQRTEFRVRAVRVRRGLPGRRLRNCLPRTYLKPNQGGNARTTNAAHAA